MQTDGLGDDAAPPRIEGPHDVGVGLGRRGRGEQERILEPQTGERDAQLRRHGKNLSKTPTIAHYNGEKSTAEHAEYTENRRLKASASSAAHMYDFSWEFPCLGQLSAVSSRRQRR